jgi:hypothetical protein
MAAAAVLLTAASGGATDGFPTSTASVTVAAGGSITAPQIVHLDAQPANADVVLAFDLTGSMGGALAQAKTDAAAIVAGVQAPTAIPGARFAIVHFQDYYPLTAYGYGTNGFGSGDLPYKLDAALTTDAASIQSAINPLTIGYGADAEEAYNRVFYESYSDPGLTYAANAQRVLVVLGDQVGHDPHGSTFNVNCPDTPYPDAGRDGVVPSADDLTTQPVLDGMKTNHVSLSFVSYATGGTTTQKCQSAMAAYTGGSLVQGSTSASPAAGQLADQIVTVVKNAAAHIGSLTATATNATETAANPASWVTFTGLPASADVNKSTGSDFPFSADVRVPADAPPGIYSVNLTVVANGVTRATQPFQITVRAPLSNLSVSVTPASVGAGIDQVRIPDVPNSFVSFYAGSTSSSPVGSTPVGSTPVGSTPVGSTPVGSTPVGSTPVGSTPLGSTPVGSTGLLDLPVGSTPVGSTALAALVLSQIPLCGDVPLPATNQVQCQADGATWNAVLNGTSFASAPLNSLSLAEVLTDGAAKSRLKALPLKDISFATTLFKSVHWSSLLLGPTPLLSLPVPTGYATWCDVLVASGGSCANVDATTTVLQADVGGQLGSAPVGSTPVGSTPVGSTPVGSTPVGSTTVGASRLATIPLSDISPATGIVDCTKVNCATQTLGDAYAANAIDPNVTYSNTVLVAAMRNAGVTINDILVAILGAAGLPWEQLPVQGLQPYSQTQSNATYTLGVSVDCSVASSFAFKVQLPQGFFPVDGTAKLTLGGTTTDAGAATVLGRTAASAAALNSYQWSLSCPAAASAITAATLTFKAYTGLKLGTFAADASAGAGGYQLDTTAQAPVTVVQNGEPANDDPGTAPTVAPNTLVVGHIAFPGDQDNYKIDLTGLPRGTKLAAFLKVPAGSDFDLTIRKPAAKSFRTAPVGSTQVGSTPIEDTGVGFSSATGVAPETLQDVPVGSTPVGSTPVGSTPVGSTSANRGPVNEAAQIVTAGESGVATIGISGYNGAASDSPYVLRVTITPPPPVPTSCPARSFANGSPSAFANGTLPSSLPTATKSIFVVNKQRLYAMYGRVTMDALLTRLGGQSTAGSFAARPEVTGTVLQVDGDPAVRSAYAAWDASPCDATLANDVVRSINDVIAGYRGSGSALPNLRYIVLLGTDEAIPMARTHDPVTLSPEENVAADLAFTTSGLTKGNALYNAAAGNNIVTDGAYGAFATISWLGRDLLVPQLSVSRLVESPDDMRTQVDRYLASSGLAGSPQTGPGTLNPATILPTGYDFLADGAKRVRDNLAANFLTATVQDTVGANPGITFPGLVTPLTPWSANDLRSAFFKTVSASGPADVASLNAHYNHYELAAADTSLLSTADATASLASRILFTMGCHGGLNVADTLGGSGGKYFDWPQLYATKLAAMYIANTGFGYGDSASVALSERLMSLFAQNLHSDAGSVGEQWAATLQQYFATRGAYDVYDAKVLEEATFYGLPFWHFSAAGTAPAFTPLTTTADPVIGTQTATMTITPTAADPTQFGLYRPLEPITSRQVTSVSGPARGLWITALQTSDNAGNATLGMPTIDLQAHEPPPNVLPIFFPASPFTLEHSVLFGRQRDYVNISGQFRPAPTASNPKAGTHRNVNSATVSVLYSTAVDDVAPLISRVTVAFAGGSAALRANVSDDSGTVAEVGALVNDGTWHFVRLLPDPADPTLFTGSIAVGVDPEVFVEATDGVNVSYSANKGSNFTSTTSPPLAGPQILIQSPVGPYGGNAVVNAAYTCPAAVTCTGTVPNNSPIDTTPGLHAFRVTATDAGGTTTTVQRVYLVGDLVLKASVTPTTATAGTYVIAQASLTNTANAARDVTLSATFAFNTAFVVNTPTVTFRMPAAKTTAVSIPFVVPKSMPAGRYSVTLRASDLAGTVTANATLVVQ